MTLLVKNVHVIGVLPEGKLDVFVLGDTISAIGNFPTKKADVVVDGQGAYLMPGFIDVHGESDHHWSLSGHRAQTELLAQGITTVVWGHEGVSLAPLFGRGMETFEAWLDTGRVNVGWKTLKEAFARFSTHPLGVNFATFAGHNLIRSGVLDGRRTFNKEDTVRWRACAGAAMKEGALGLSMNPRTLAARIEPKEIRLIQAAVRAEDGVFAFGGGSGVDPELLPVLLGGKGRKLWTTFRASSPKELKSALAAIEASPEARFEVAPFEGDVRPLYTYLPEWAWQDDLALTARQLKDEWTTGRIMKDLPAVDPDSWWLVKSERQPSLVGRSLRELMGVFDLSKSETLLRVFRDTGLRGLAVERRTDPKTLRKLISHPQAFIGSHGAAVTPEVRAHMAELAHDVMTFPEYLKIATEKSSAALPHAVDRITRAPAEFLRIPRRGSVKEGYFADLVGMREGKVVFTIVNGRLAWQEGGTVGVPCGRALPILPPLPAKHA